ncbi:MurR/RpiR family transcriptional regulator [Salipaludibacillus sp. CF4.18]|uniref:MurR/RpiR family transcriptional regulator n=1 Tax=Salipaludibacillus sp. CF4.18 TaxID=3373081 RepID=UPI003EE5B62C
MTSKESCHSKHRILALYSSFRAKDKKIADYILEQPDEIIHSSISQVADNLCVAESTIFRFCKKIGFKGYRAMKISLASEVATCRAYLNGFNQESITEKVFKSNIHALEETLSIIDGEVLKEAVKSILLANLVHFYGDGGSGATVLDAHHKFINTGIPTASYTDSHLQLMSASQLSDQDVAVFISQTGSNHDILKALEIAKNNGATTIGITTLTKSPLSDGVDIPLYTISDETDYRSEALSSQLAQLSIIDALYVNVRIGLNGQMQQSLSKIRDLNSMKKI